MICKVICYAVLPKAHLKPKKASAKKGEVFKGETDVDNNGNELGENGDTQTDQLQKTKGAGEARRCAFSGNCDDNTL